MSAIKIHNLGFPRIGRNRELKKAVEAFWKSGLTPEELEVCGREIKQTNWQIQQELDFFPVNDFSYYDQVLDMSCLLGVTPKRFADKELSDLGKYFAIARGNDSSCASEMTKWFDTNYHYIVPEISEDTVFSLSSDKIFREYAEAADKKARPVLIGPVTYLTLAEQEGQESKLKYLTKLLPVYIEILEKLKEAGAEWVQLDEPVFSTDLTVEQRQALVFAYEKLAKVDIKILLVNYFDALGDNLDLFFQIPAQAYHIDAVAGSHEIPLALEKLPGHASLSLGVVSGRNIWRSNYQEILNSVSEAAEVLGSRLWLAASCSLLHVPYSLRDENNLPDDVKTWLAFAEEKIQELQDIKKLLSKELGHEHILHENQYAINSRQINPAVKDVVVRRRVYELVKKDFSRADSYSERRELQQQKLQLPLLPSTTIGSFPQTKEVRQYRARHKKGLISSEEYEEFLREEIRLTVEVQNEIGLDVLVHGEPERNDMVEYFGEQLNGFAFTSLGWVQSYGSRCVKPPIIYGDISRQGTMTAKWSLVAKEFAGNKPMKGMLTGPVTMLKWSFVRDDLPVSEVAYQMALALRDETIDLEAAGLEVIQVDEPAIREGLPLKSAEKETYLQWAVDSFRLSTAGVQSSTQIHTHMCYSDFNEIIEAIAALDADVISVETSRSNQALLEVFKRFRYPNEIGPGVYDIHSPRVPSVEEIKSHILAACEILDIEKVWINPDCGLKTRGWEETKAALSNMVTAIQAVRQELAVLN